MLLHAIHPAHRAVALLTTTCHHPAVLYRGIHFPSLVPEVIMFSPSRLAKVAYVSTLALAVCLLLRPNLSQAQYRGLPTPPGFPHIGGMPAPEMMLPLTNMLTDTTGAAMSMGLMGGMGGVMMGMGGGMMGMMGMMGMGGGMMGMMGMMGMGGMMMGGMMGMGGMMMGMMGMGGMMMGMGGMGGMMMGGMGMMGMRGMMGMYGMGGMMMGMGGMSMMGGMMMGGMSMMGMMGFAGKGFGGFNGKKAL
jgi:hypothetical protein